MGRDLEHQEQKALFNWATIQSKKYPELALMFSIPNGGLRNKVVAAKLRAEGVKAGVPDIFLPAPRGSLAGLFIEMKPTPNKVLKIPVRKPSEAQKRYIESLNEQGYLAVVCYGWQVASEVIIKYLKS